MSGWDASARPSWDPQGGDGENTQAFSAAPDSPDAASGPWHEPAAPQPGPGYRGRHQDMDPGGRRPSRHRSDPLGADPKPAGAPPDIFQQDYGPQDHAQQDYFSQDRARQDQARQDDARYGAQRDLTSKDYVGKDWWDQLADRDQPAGRDRLADRGPLTDRDQPAGRDRLADRPPDRGWAADRDRPPGRDDAARMDPALADFFAPQPSRTGAGQPGPGQPGPGQQRGGRGYPGQGPGPDGGPRPTRPGGVGMSAAGHARGPARPGGPGRAPSGPFAADQRSRWDSPAMNPATRSGRRQSSRPARRGIVTVGLPVGLVVAIGIAIGVVLLTHKPAATTTAGAKSTPTAGAAQPTGGAGTKSAGTSGQPAAKPAGYTLTTPATAGGYARLAAASATVQDVATTTAQSVRQHAVQAGGKITSQVTGYYQLSGGQVMSFTGYQGTFDPAKVLADSGGQAYPAGPHGGGLVCTPSAGTPGGTVCVWATGTTLGITEFFGSSGSPEVVSMQSKAAGDTVNLRSDVERAKS